VRSASITYMIRHYVARRAQVIEDHPHNADERTRCLHCRCLIERPVRIRLLVCDHHEKRRKTLNEVARENLAVMISAIMHMAAHQAQP
jgi:hypothetical protein